MISDTVKGGGGGRGAGQAVDTLSHLLFVILRDNGESPYSAVPDT